MRDRDVMRIVWLCCLAAAVGAGCRMRRKEMQVSPRDAYVDARTLLLDSAADPDPQVRTHAVEALASVEPKSARGVLLQALGDDRLPVMAAAVIAAGDIRCAEAKKELLEMARSEDPAPPPKLMCALIYALHRLGDDTHTSGLGALLHHEDKYVRAEAARIMGKMGEPSGVGPLKSRQNDEREIAVRLNIAEALALLGDERSLGLLEAFTKDQYLESQLIAIEGLGRLHHPRARYVLGKIVRDRQQDPLVRVAAAKGLARLGDASGYGRALSALSEPRRVLRRARGRKAEIRDVEVVGLQTQAALALGHMKNKLAVDALHPLLNSERGSVRVAAAQAILQLLQPFRDAAAPKPAKTPRAALEPEMEEPETPLPRRPKLHTSGGRD